MRAADPLVAPRIETNYLAPEADCRAVVAGLRMLREIYSRATFRGHCEAEVLPGPEAKSDADLLAFAQSHGSTVSHCSGTCRMGSDARSVVDPERRVRGVEGLRVIDASVMPTVTAAYTSAAALMIGEKGAALVRASAF